MSHLFRYEQIEIDGYYFINHQGLYWHSGHFWDGEQKVKQVYNNGSLAILFGTKKLGVKKLRPQAIKCKIKLLKQKLPF